MSIKDRLWNGQSYPTLPRSSNASPATESENNRPADQGAIGELRAEASSLITMRDLNGQRMISAKFNHVFSIFQFPIMLCIWGGKQKSKMADEFVKTFPELNSHSSVAKKNKNELRKICKILELPSEKLRKNALINVVCNSLKIPMSCSKPNARDSNADMLFTSGDVEVPACLKITPAYLQHVKGWVKSLRGFPSQLDMRAVGNYLLGEGFTQDQVVKYKTNRAWDHKRGIHSVR